MKYLKSFHKESLLNESSCFVHKGDINVLLYTSETEKEFYFKPAEEIKETLNRISQAGGKILNMLVDKTENKWVFKDQPNSGVECIVNWYLVPQNDETFIIWTAKDFEGKNHNIGIYKKNNKCEIDDIKLLKYLTSIIVDKL